MCRPNLAPLPPRRRVLAVCLGVPDDRYRFAFSVLKRRRHGLERVFRHGLRFGTRSRGSCSEEPRGDRACLCELSRSSNVSRLVYDEDAQNSTDVYPKSIGASTARRSRENSPRRQRAVASEERHDESARAARKGDPRVRLLSCFPSFSSKNPFGFLGCGASPREKVRVCFLATTIVSSLK